MSTWNGSNSTTARKASRTLAVLTISSAVSSVYTWAPPTAPASCIMLARKCYVVLRGRQPGLYGSWEECERETSGFKSSEHSVFSGPLALEQALAFWRLKLWRVACMAPTPP